MSRIWRARGKALFFCLVLLLVLAACGESVESLKAEGDGQGLIDILGDPEEKGRTRKEAALALGDIGDPAAVEPLILYMQECAETLDAPSSTRSEEEWQACSDAIEPVSKILGKMGDARAVEPLIEMLDDHWVHDEAVQALGMLNDPRAILPLIVSLDQGLGTFGDVGDRWVELYDIVLNLAAHGTPETFESLRDALPGLEAEKQDSIHVGERCRKYRLALFALDAMQDPRREALLLSRLETFDSDCDLDVPSMMAKLYDYDAAKLLPFVKVGYPEDFAVIYFQITPTPKPIEVDSASIYDYSYHTQVVMTGRLSTPGIVVCDPDCGVGLRDPSTGAGDVSVLLHVGSQMNRLRNPYEKEDLWVYMDNGEAAGHQSLVRITGTLCAGPTGTVRGLICDVTRIEPVK